MCLTYHLSSDKGDGRAGGGGAGGVEDAGVGQEKDQNQESEQHHWNTLTDRSIHRITHRSIETSCKRSNNLK